MRSFRIAFQHIRRSPYQVVVAVVTIALTFYLASIFGLLLTGSQMLLNYFETRPQVTAFFQDDVKMSQIDELKVKLGETGKVASTKYISKEEALSVYREENKDDPSLLEMVTANILPASMEVSAKDISYLSDVASMLKEEPGVEDVIYQEDVVASLKNLTSNVRRIGLEQVGSLGIVSFLIVSVITAIKVVLRKEEIEILQLIGASRWYIRLPFLVEGMLYGIMGAILGWGIAYIRILYLAPQLAGFLKDTPIPSTPPMYFMMMMLSAEILLGMFIGTLGSFVALRRYLK